MARKAIVLLSGGMDSSTALAIAAQKGFELYALSFYYGQKNLFELKCAKRLARQFAAKKHLIIHMSMKEIGGSALTSSIPVPKKRDEAEMSMGIPVTYVPARNTIFLSFALAWAETLPSRDIFIGVNYLDSSGYPDCRPEFIASFEKMANLATRIGTEGKERIKVHAPLIEMKKNEIIRKGIQRGVDFSMTSSCYDPLPGGVACGGCDSCVLRLKGFRDAGIIDPIKYSRKYLSKLSRCKQS